MASTVASALRESLLAGLNSGLKAMGLELAESAREQLIDYVLLLNKWNRTYNLTAVRDPQEMVERHLLDSLALLPYVAGQRLLDVGTGGGLPGIPLAITDPAREVVLLDSNSKKTRFLIQAKGALGLERVSVVHSRLEQYQPPFLFERIVARAFTSLADLVEMTRHLLTPQGEILAMKGLYPEEELQALPEGIEVIEVVPLTVPGTEAERHLVRMRTANQ